MITPDTRKIYIVMDMMSYKNMASSIKYMSDSMILVNEWLINYYKESGAWDEDEEPTIEEAKESFEFYKIIEIRADLVYKAS